jgi:hypothetical protein
MDFLSSLISPNYSAFGSGGSSVASGVDTMMLGYGFSPDVSGTIGGLAGAYGQSQMPGSTLGGGSAAPNQSGAANIQQQIQCWNSQNLLYATPGDTSACNSSSSTVVNTATKAATAANNVFGSWWGNLTFSGIVSAVLGVGMIVGALYLFGSASLSDAIASAVKGK